MESQLQRPSDGHDHHEDSGTHSMVVGGKKTVLKKVKDKAKKIKDTIKKHGHLHHHDDDQEKDHEVHGGAPTLKSTVARETDLDKPNDDHRVTDKGDQENKNALPLPKTDPNKAKIESPVRLGEEEEEEEEDHHFPNNTPGSNNTHSTPTGDSGGADQDSPNKPLSESASALEYAHKFAETVYEKVAGAGSAVVSMVQPNGNENENASSSVKEYLSEKLKPGDDDKALSEAITDALPKREEPQPRAKVTVSKEVAERLGTDRESKREGEDAVAAGEQSSGNGVVERLENAFTSWLSDSDGIQTAQDSLSNSFVNNPSSASGGGGVQPTSGSREETRHQ